jgi:hypothetical protein
MIRIILGVLILFGVGGGVDNMPPNPSLSYIFAVMTLVAVGFGLALWGVKDIQK